MRIKSGVSLLHSIGKLGSLALIVTLPGSAAERFVSPYGGHIEPFTEWSTAATNIQAAIDAASDGDVIWVTNGVYNTGGKVMAGDLTNRVALDKPITVQSVNGPYVTTIEGAWDPMTNGSLAVRCAWLTNGANLKGFTLRRGATRATGASFDLGCGGGAWCASSDASIASCILTANAAYSHGSGVFHGTVFNCAINHNSWASDSVFEAALTACTVVWNSGYGTYSCGLTNCIVYFNSATYNNSSPYSVSYCCTTPLPAGEGNISADPQLLSDDIHLANSSPCRGAGVNLGNGKDIDGQSWLNPPCIGCDEWQPSILVMKPRIRYALEGFSINASIAGDAPYACWWSKDGVLLEDNDHFQSTRTANLVSKGLSLSDIGSYQFVASNALGAATSSVQVAIHCVNAAGAVPVPPYDTWATAATNIQAAIDLATEGDLVWVTNGVYKTSGKVMAGDLTNRVALDKPVTVQSVNGPYVTTIEGAWDPMTNGPLAVRCAWVTNGATLRGFTLQKGATRSTGDTVTLLSGGGAWCFSSAATIEQCVFKSNGAKQYGGGVYQGTVLNSAIMGNVAAAGGAYNAFLYSCTVVDNTAYGTYGCGLTNCIIYFNSPANNYGGKGFAYCCTTPSVSGPGNISAEPQLLSDRIHLANSSPCSGTGTNLVTGADIDDEVWAGPPSIGCDEWQSAPLVVKPSIEYSMAGFSMRASIAGLEPYVCWWMKDGVPLVDDGHFRSTATTNLVVAGVSLADVGGYQAIVSNALGVATSAVAQLVIHCVDAAGTGPVPPYSSWEAAATNIQAAIDVASAGDLIWVTNGVYETGGKVVAGNLINRVALDKALTVQSVNGPFVTVIKGAGATNGTTAVRCAWVADGAVLAGFTLRDGATRTSFNTDQVCGGGVWCVSSNATVANCIMSNNTAQSRGAAVYQGTVQNCLMRNNSCPYGCAENSALINCTVISNACYGLYNGTATNSILYYNTGSVFWPNYQGSTRISYCCTMPRYDLTTVTNEPQLISDGFHIGNSSPCLRAGTNVALGADIDGHAWANPPSIGCDEWEPAPLVLSPVLQLTNYPAGFRIRAPVTGQEPYTCYWFRDGVLLKEDGHYLSAHTPNLSVNGVWSTDGGTYQVVVSNSFGMATSTVARLVVHHVHPKGTLPTPPYGSWATAATNIQDAVDAALPGEVVLVTNGVYASGGKAMDGVLTNRVVLDKVVLVQSVNGPAVTIIKGAWDPGTIVGPLAVRCVWMTNSAMLSGFTLLNGATFQFPGTNPPAIFHYGGGVLGTATNASLANCVLRGNYASVAGGGACSVTLNNCTLVGNVVTGGSVASEDNAQGGGASFCDLNNCWVTENSSMNKGGGVYSCTLRNCAVTKNFGVVGGGANQSKLMNCTLSLNSIAKGGRRFILYPYGGGAHSSFLTNCIVWNNRDVTPGGNQTNNHYSCTFVYSSSMPLPAGLGNTNSNPLLQWDGVHLAENSPCRGAGTNLFVIGGDIDGQGWANPPSMGCDEWSPAPALPGLLAMQASGRPLQLSLQPTALSGQGPLSFSWLIDGHVIEEGGPFSSAQTTNLVVSGLGPEQAGAYQLVASNAFGVSTSTVAQVVVHCVDSSGGAPVPPYSDWQTAATNIQDALDAAVPGEIVLVTNGLYATGGRIMVDDLVNRVALGPNVLLTSVNGAEATTIEGAWDPVSTNGPLAIRCAWLSEGSTLDGFTLRGGATRNTGNNNSAQSGGGVWCATTNGAVVDCVLSGNSAAYLGGGAYRTSLTRSKLIGNSARTGGGCYDARLYRCILATNSVTEMGGGTWSSTLYSCFLHHNWAGISGGGAAGAELYNCTVTENAAVLSGGGILGGSGEHCIVSYNSIGLHPADFGSSAANWSSYTFVYHSCSTPRIPGTGNIDADPQVMNDGHLALTSPCRGFGFAVWAFGTDLDGEPWKNPPSIGCDEVVESAFAGPLSVSLDIAQPGVVGKVQTLFGQVSGRTTRVEWTFGDGSVLTNASSLRPTHTWTAPGDYVVTFTAFNNDHPEGVSTNLVLHVEPLIVPALTLGNYDGTNFALSFPTQSNMWYFVERSTNLVPPVIWEKIGTAEGFGEPISVVDGRATNTANFYRVRAE